MIDCPHCHAVLDPAASRCPQCGAPRDDAAVPSLVDGRYEIERVLGEGSMGLVYLARDTGLDRWVALKFIAAQFVRDARAVERFRREAAALAAVRHEHVVAVHAFGRHADGYFFAMEYVAGVDLDDVLAAHAAHGAPVPVALALSILGRVARGLAAVHAAGLLHRDVKPANIVIEDRTGRPVLLDLGLSTPFADMRHANEPEIVGSPPYMAPEQIESDLAPDGLRPAADIYALGCTAYELLTGQLPFPGESIPAMLRGHLHAPPPRLSALRPELADLDVTIARALAKDASDRHPTAAAFALEIEQAQARRGLAADEAGASTPPMRMPPTSRPAASPMAATIATAATAVRTDAPVRLLILDDDVVFRRALERAARVALPDAKLDVMHAESGPDALDRAAESPPHVVLIDYDMPGMNGVEALALLRGQAGAERVPAIVVTAHDTAHVRWRFGLLGVTEFLTKPTSLEAIAAAIRRCVA